MDSLCAAFDLARFGVDNGGQAGDRLHQPLASFQPVGLLIACQICFISQVFKLFGEVRSVIRSLLDVGHLCSGLFVNFGEVIQGGCHAFIGDQVEEFGQARNQRLHNV